MVHRKKLTDEQKKLLAKIKDKLEFLQDVFKQVPESRIFMKQSHQISAYSYRSLSDTTWLKYWMEDVLPGLMNGSRHYTLDAWNTAMVMKSLNLLWKEYNHLHI